MVWGDPIFSGRAPLSGAALPFVQGGLYLQISSDLRQVLGHISDEADSVQSDDESAAFGARIAGSPGGFVRYLGHGETSCSDPGVFQNEEDPDVGWV